MMREIKFRAFLKKPGYIVDVHIVDWQEKYIVHEDLNHNFHDVAALDVPDPECVTKFEDCELMQFTGLADKSGKEIYEGDLLKHSIQGDIQDKFLIVENMWDLRISLEHADPYYRINHDSLEIMGNIHENLELLENSYGR